MNGAVLRGILGILVGVAANYVWQVIKARKKAEKMVNIAFREMAKEFEKKSSQERK